MIYISANQITKKHILIKSSRHELDETLYKLRNMNDIEILNLYKDLKQTIYNKVINLNESSYEWKIYTTDIIIYYCIRKFIFDINIPIIHSIELPLHIPY